MILLKSEHWEVHKGGEPCDAFLSFPKNWDYLIMVAKCDDASIIMQDRGGEYGLKGNLWVIATQGIKEFLSWTRYCKKYKLPNIYFWKNMIWSSIVCERLRFSQHVIWKVVFNIICHMWKVKEKQPIRWNEEGPTKKEHQMDLLCASQVP